MLYREIIVVCFEIHTKHINRVCGQNVEFVNVKLLVYIVTFRFKMGGGGVGPSKHNCCGILFIWLTMTTFFGRAWPTSGHKLIYK